MPQDVRERMQGNGRVPEVVTFTAAELLAMELPPIRWAIPDILPEGVTILAGRAKIGKSFLAYGWCIAIATGSYALGRVPVGRGDVLYLALEDNKRRLQKRLKSLLAGAEAPDNLTLAIEWPRLDDGGVDKLDAWLEAHPDARLVVIDILKSIRPSGGTGRNLYDLDYESLEPLKPLIEKYGVSIVVVHHLNQGTSTDPLQLISGSEGLVGVVDGTLVLRRERGKMDATLHVSGKDVEEEREHALRWDAATTSWILAGDAEDFRMSDERREIRDAMRALGRPATTAEVAHEVDKDYKATRYLMGKMEDEGIIKLHHTEGATKYYIVPSNPPPRNPRNTRNTSDAGNPIMDDSRVSREGTAPPDSPDSHADSGDGESVSSDSRVSSGESGLPLGAESLIRATFEADNGAARNLPLYLEGDTTLEILANSVLGAMGRKWDKMGAAERRAWEQAVERVVEESKLHAGVPREESRWTGT